MKKGRFFKSLEESPFSILQLGINRAPMLSLANLAMSCCSDECVGQNPRTKFSTLKNSNDLRCASSLIGFMKSIGGAGGGFTFRIEVRMIRDVRFPIGGCLVRWLALLNVFGCGTFPQ